MHLKEELKSTKEVSAGEGLQQSRRRSLPVATHRSMPRSSRRPAASPSSSGYAEQPQHHQARAVRSLAQDLVGFAGVHPSAHRRELGAVFRRAHSPEEEWWRASGCAS